MGWLRRVSRRTAARALGVPVELMLCSAPRIMGRIAAPFAGRPRTSSSTIQEEADALGYQMRPPSRVASGTAPSTTPTRVAHVSGVHVTPRGELRADDALARATAEGDLPGREAPEGQGSGGQADARGGLRSIVPTQARLRSSHSLASELSEQAELDGS